MQRNVCESVEDKGQKGVGQAARLHLVCISFTIYLLCIPQIIALRRPNPNLRDTHCGKPMHAKLKEKLLIPPYTILISKIWPDALS